MQKLVYEAMAYNFAKHIGALAAAAKGKVDAIGITGGLAYSDMLMGWLKEYISFLAPIYIYPGECEMESIYSQVKAVEEGKEQYKIYRKSHALKNNSYDRITRVQSTQYVAR